MRIGFAARSSCADVTRERQAQLLAAQAERPSPG